MLANRRTTERLLSYLRGLARRRSNGVVTADDVHRYLDVNTTLGPEYTDIRLSYINSAFQSGEFRPTGYEVSSERPAAKSRMISEWTTA